MGPIDIHVSILGLGKVLVQNRRQAIILISGDQDRRRHMTSLGHDRMNP